MKAIVGFAVAVIALNLATLFADGGHPTNLHVKHAMESSGTAELILKDPDFAKFLPTKKKSEAYISICLAGNGKTGLLTLLKVQKTLKADPNGQAYTRVVLFIVREKAGNEPETSRDTRPRAQKLADFQPIIDALSDLLPANGLTQINQDTATTLENVMEHIHIKKTAVNIDAKVGSGKATDDIQPKLLLASEVDKKLKDIPLLANDITSGKGSKNEGEGKDKVQLAVPTAVISVHQVHELQRPKGLVLLDNTKATQAEIKEQIVKGEAYLTGQNKPTGHGIPIKVAYVSLNENKTEEMVITALQIVNNIPTDWLAAFNLINVELADFLVPV